MAASLEVCTLDMMSGGGAAAQPRAPRSGGAKPSSSEALKELEGRICRLLRCEPGRAAAELQVEGYVCIRNDIVRHVDGGFRAGGPVRRSVLFPGGGLVVLLEIDGDDCAVTLRWDAPSFTPDQSAGEAPLMKRGAADVNGIE
jgi:hypothetical protein